MRTVVTGRPNVTMDQSESDFLGARAAILKVVSIGNGAVVDAESVVTKDAPPGAIVGVNPVRVIGSVFQQASQEQEP